jgi:hypothetical protein
MVDGPPGGHPGTRNRRSLGRDHREMDSIGIKARLSAASGAYFLLIDVYLMLIYDNFEGQKATNEAPSICCWNVVQECLKPLVPPPLWSNQGLFSVLAEVVDGMPAGMA